MRFALPFTLLLTLPFLSCAGLNGGAMMEGAGYNDDILFYSYDEDGGGYHVFLLRPGGEEIDITRGLFNDYPALSLLLPTQSPYPVPSWNGEEVYLLAAKEGGGDDFEIYVMDPSGNYTSITSLQGVPVKLSSSSSGEYLYLQVQRSGEEKDIIYTVAMEGKSEVLSFSNSVSLKKSSPSDNSFAVIENRSDSATSSLYLIDPDSDTRTEVFGMEGYSVSSPSFSPDGRDLVFETFRTEDNQRDIFCTDLDTLETSNLTEDFGGSPNSPLSSPAMKSGGDFQILFLSRVLGNHDIYVMNLKGEYFNRLTSSLQGGGEINSPLWSPDGLNILFEYRATDYDQGIESSELYRVAATGGEDPVILTQNFQGTPYFSHYDFTGTTILFWDYSTTAATYEGGDIFIISGTSVIPLTEGRSPKPLYPLWLTRNHYIY